MNRPKLMQRPNPASARELDLAWSSSSSMAKICSNFRQILANCSKVQQSSPKQSIAYLSAFTTSVFEFEALQESQFRKTALRRISPSLV